MNDPLRKKVPRWRDGKCHMCGRPSAIVEFIRDVLDPELEQLRAERDLLLRRLAVTERAP